jgi:hypothetical protein
MKQRKVQFKVFFGLILILILSINSCKKQNCQTCVKINPTTLQVIDTQTSCQDDVISHFESRGYSCN